MNFWICRQFFGWEKGQMCKNANQIFFARLIVWQTKKAGQSFAIISGFDLDSGRAA
jgi:hypothetical protein